MPDPVTERRHEERFIDYLVQLHTQGDRAALASLRRVLGKRLGDVPRADRVLLPWLSVSASERRARALYLIGGLFATYPEQSAVPLSFAASFQRLCAAQQRPSLELRFHALLKAHEDEVPEHLRRLTQLLKANGIPIDWPQLFRDVLGWNDDERRVQRRWARDFWGATLGPTPSDHATHAVPQEMTNAD
jgi:CRISPR type I-E-associated protein CasB/Cse2